MTPPPMTKERFAEIRAWLGLSARLMGMVMGISSRTVFAYESGRSLVPGCTSRFLEVLVAVPAARAHAFREAGVPITSPDRSKTPGR